MGGQLLNTVNTYSSIENHTWYTFLGGCFLLPLLLLRVGLRLCTAALGHRLIPAELMGVIGLPAGGCTKPLKYSSEFWCLTTRYIAIL